MVRRISYKDAVNEALIEEMDRDESIFMIGFASFSFIFGTAQKIGLSDFAARVGKHKLVDSPLCEGAMVGCALGAAMTGMRPVVCLGDNAFMLPAYEQVVNEVAKLRYVTAGQLSAPMLIMVTFGGGISRGATHSQTLYPGLMNVPGLIVVAPSTPFDAKGLLKHALKQNDPVIFMSHVNLVEKTGDVPDGDYETRFSECTVRRRGNDVTLIGISNTVDLCLRVAEELEPHGISAEVIDQLTLVPMDLESMVSSVRRTRRLVVVDESPRTCSAASQIVASICERCGGTLERNPVIIANPDVPIPYSPFLERRVLPSTERVLQSVLDMFGRK